MNYLLGVELYGNSLKIAAFKKSRQSLELIKLDQIYFSNDGGESLKQLIAWRDQNLPDLDSIKTVLTVSESNLYIKEIEFPKIPNEQLNEAVYWEIPSVAPIPQSEAVYDWRIVSEEKDILKTLVVVGKNAYIENIISMFRDAGIEVVAIEPSSYAFAGIADADFTGNTLLCVVEEYGTDFIVLKGKLPFFTTSVTSNPQSGKGSRIRSEKDLTTEITAGAKKIIDYWEEKESLSIRQVLLAGDIVYKYYGLSASVNLFSQVPTLVVKSRKVKSLSTKSYKDLELVSYLPSLGAGVRHLQKDVLEGINLFPRGEKQKTENIRNQKNLTAHLFALTYLNIVFLIIIIVSIFTLNMWWFSMEKQLEKLNGAVSAHPANEIVAEINDTNLAIQNVIDLTKRQEDVGEKLKTISKLTPQTIKITSIGLINNKEEEWLIEGIGDRGSILAFYEMISQNVKSSDITMPYSNFNKLTDNEFSISIIW